MLSFLVQKMWSADSYRALLVREVRDHRRSECKVLVSNPVQSSQEASYRKSPRPTEGKRCPRPQEELRGPRT